MVANFTFKHYGFSGSLTVSDPLNVTKIEECIKVAKREELLILLASLLSGMKDSHGSEQDLTMTTLQLADLYKISEVIVFLNNGVRFRVV
jgi:hypothetical protein